MIGSQVRDLALHVLSLMENSVETQASVISLTIHADRQRDLLKVTVEDNGFGLAAAPEQVMDPEYTTRSGKRIGQGMNQLQTAVQQAGGYLRLRKSGLGGLAVEAGMRLSNGARPPLGDLAAVISSVICTNPNLDLRCEFRNGEMEWRVTTAEAMRDLPRNARGGLALARWMAERVRRGLEEAQIQASAPGEANQWMRDLAEGGRGRSEKETGMSEKKMVSCACGETVSEETLLGRLDDVLAEYKGKPGALIPVLQIAQGMFGYLPEEALKRIALALDKPYSEVAGVVGFYAFFSTVPRGKHVIRVCLGTACYVRGGKRVLEAIQQKLNIEVGQTTEDRMFSLEVARCFGACGLAPTICIDTEVYKRVRPIKVAEIIDRYYKEPAPAQGGEAHVHA